MKTIMLNPTHQCFNFQDSNESPITLIPWPLCKQNVHMEHFLYSLELLTIWQIWRLPPFRCSLIYLYTFIYYEIYTFPTCMHTHIPSVYVLLNLRNKMLAIPLAPTEHLLNHILLRVHIIPSSIFIIFLILYH